MSASEVVQVPSAPHAGSGRSTQVSDEEYTRFERARILGARALQVSLGAPILTDVPPTLIDPVEIAEREFQAGMIPITVRRGKGPN